MGLGFIFLDRVKYGFDRGWTFFHVGLGFFFFYMGWVQIWVFHGVGCGYSNFKTLSLGYNKLPAKTKFGLMTRWGVEIV